MLSGLTSRPNVQSTLILSRHDGSIIKATGVVAGENPGSRPTTSYTRAEESKKSEDNDGDKTEESSDISTLNYGKAAETLASAIFDFVNTAVSLGTRLGETAQSNSSLKDQNLTDQKQRPQHPSDEGVKNQNNDDEVKLLRMRTKRQEVIIFPDSKFLCCVVQSTEKSSG